MQSLSWNLSSSKRPKGIGLETNRCQLLRNPHSTQNGSKRDSEELHERIGGERNEHRISIAKVKTSNGYDVYP